MTSQDKGKREENEVVRIIAVSFFCLVGVFVVSINDNKKTEEETPVLPQDADPASRLIVGRQEHQDDPSMVNKGLPVHRPEPKIQELHVLGKLLEGHFKRRLPTPDVFRIAEMLINMDVGITTAMESAGTFDDAEKIT